MKKIFTLILALGTGIFAFGQNVIETNTISSIEEMKKAPFNISAMKIPTDTLALTKFFSAGQASFIGNQGGGYVVGVNNISGTSSTASGQGYIMGEFGFASYYIEEVLIWVGAKEETSGSGCSIKVSIHLLDDSSFYGDGGANNYAIASPGSKLGSDATVSWANIDTASGMITQAQFPAPILVDQDYVIVVDYTDCANKGDTVGFILSGQNANVFDAEFQFYYFTHNVTPFWALYGDIYNIPDRMIAYWPVVDASSSSVEDDQFAHGMKLSAYPNPASDANLAVAFELAKAGNTTIEIYDVSGRIVFTKTIENALNGRIHSIDVDISNFADGSYYYSLTTNGQRLTKKLLVTK